MAIARYHGLMPPFAHSVKFLATWPPLPALLPLFRQDYWGAVAGRSGISKWEHVAGDVKKHRGTLELIISQIICLVPGSDRSTSDFRGLLFIKGKNIGLLLRHSFAPCVFSWGWKRFWNFHPLHFKYVSLAQQSLILIPNRCGNEEKWNFVKLGALFFCRSVKD